MKKLLPFLAILLLLSACAPAQSVELVDRNIFYAGEDDGVKTALALAEYTLVTDPAQAEVFVLNGEIPNVDAIAEQVNNGAGLVLILGVGTSEADVHTLLGQDVKFTYAEDAVSLTDSEDVSDPLLTEIIWNGAPQIRERTIVDGFDSQAQTIVSTYETDEGVLWKLPGETFVFTAWLSGEANPQIQEWGYFNYLIYHLVERAAGATPLSFAEYPASPVPHADDRNTLFVFLGVELIFFFSAFIFVRRYSLKHPEALDSLVANRSRFEVQEEATSWEKVGFHRPLSGLLVGMGIGILM